MCEFITAAVPLIAVCHISTNKRFWQTCFNNPFKNTSALSFTCLQFGGIVLTGCLTAYRKSGIIFPKRKTTLSFVAVHRLPWRLEVIRPITATILKSEISMPENDSIFLSKCCVIYPWPAIWWLTLNRSNNIHAITTLLLRPTPL